MSIASDMVAQLALAVASQGVAGTFGRAKDPAAAVPVRFLMKHPGVRDEAIVNAYGVSAQIITLPHIAEFAAAPPEKFDFVIEDVDAARPLPYVFDAVVRREVAGVVIAWTAYVKGKGA
jgi:hypothetical protein